MLRTLTTLIPHRFSRVPFANLIGVGFLILIGGWGLDCSADVIHVPGDYPTIQEGIDAALGGDIVEIADGTYTGFGNKDLDFFGKAITVRSASGDPELCVIDCEEDGRGLYFHSGEGEDSAVEGLTITNGYTNENSPSFNYGSGVYCEDSSPSLTNCIITGNTAEGSYAEGGGIHCNLSHPTLTNCMITDNMATGHSADGGGVWCGNGSNPTLFSCTITGNTATGGDYTNGGGVYCREGSEPKLTNCMIIGNTAGHNGGQNSHGGGLFCNEHSNPTLINCTIRSNVVAANRGYSSGGGIYCLGGNSLFMDCTIIDNKVDDREGEGGGIYCQSNDLMLANCTISGNEAGDIGGGVSCMTSAPTLINCTISGNKAKAYGGGIDCYMSSPTLINCLVIDNTAYDTHGGGRGGGISCYSFANPTLTDCIINGNTAHLDGGGVYCGNESSPTLTDCIVTDNITEYGDGGGVNCSSTSNPTLTNCLIASNTGHSGGGVSCYMSSPMLFSCAIMSNMADYGCGFMSYGGHPTLTGCTISSNTTGDYFIDDGGGAYFNRSSPTLTNCSITYNMAGYGGGVYCRNNSNPKLINCSITSNIAEYGAALMCDSSYHTDPSNVVMSNCILWNDVDQIWNRDGSILTFTYCDVEGGWDGVGNVDADPLFVDQTNGDYRLMSGSLCIDAGDNGMVPDGIETDLDGNPRYVDDVGKPDIGAGEAPIVDIGCYEFQETSVNALTIVPTPLVSGQEFEVMGTNAVPDADAWLLYSLAGLGNTYIKALDVMVDLDSPLLATGPRLTDENADVSVILTAPHVGNATDVWFQGVQYGEVSNYVGTRIVVE